MHQSLVVPSIYSMSKMFDDCELTLYALQMLMDFKGIWLDHSFYNDIWSQHAVSLVCSM